MTAPDGDPLTGGPTAPDVRERVRHILSSGYACMTCLWLDLWDAIGEPKEAPHDHI